MDGNTVGAHAVVSTHRHRSTVGGSSAVDVDVEGKGNVCDERQRVGGGRGDGESSVWVCSL